MGKGVSGVGVGWYKIRKSFTKDYLHTLAQWWQCYGGNTTSRSAGCGGGCGGGGDVGGDGGGGASGCFNVTEMGKYCK